jgi:hypothetical protein
MKTKLAIFVMLAVILTPSAALANAGTPLLWAGIFHLSLGNALIGIGEGLLLSKLFKVSRWKQLLLIPANYLSAWVGLLLVNAPIMTNSPVIKALSDITIEVLPFWFWSSIFLFFGITLILEYPFFWFALRQKENALQEALRATVIVNGISYLILFGCYGAISSTSLLTQLEVVSPTQIQAPKGYDLYFITPDGKEVVKTDLLGMGRQQIKTVNSPQPLDKLLVRRNGQGKVELFIQSNDRASQFREEIILPNLTASVPLPEQLNGYPIDRRKIPKLTSSTDWEYRTGFWAVEGIYGENKKQNLRFRFALETPLISWFPENATHIDGDLVVFALNNNQICILQPQERKIALVSRGSRPVVAKL